MLNYETASVVFFCSFVSFFLGYCLKRTSKKEKKNMEAEIYTDVYFVCDKLLFSIKEEEYNEKLKGFSPTACYKAGIVAAMEQIADTLLDGEEG